MASLDASEAATDAAIEAKGKLDAMGKSTYVKVSYGTGHVQRQYTSRQNYSSHRDMQLSLYRRAYLYLRWRMVGWYTMVFLHFVQASGLVGQPAA